MKPFSWGYSSRMEIPFAQACGVGGRPLFGVPSGNCRRFERAVAGPVAGPHYAMRCAPTASAPPASSSFSIASSPALRSDARRGVPYPSRLGRRLAANQSRHHPRRRGALPRRSARHGSGERRRARHPARLLLHARPRAADHARLGRWRSGRELRADRSDAGRTCRPATNCAFSATPASCASLRDSATMSGLYSTPSARAPSLAAAITLRPSPDPRSITKSFGVTWPSSISLLTMSGGDGTHTTSLPA